MTDNEILESAIALVNDGLSVTFPVKGRSMLPFIIGGSESVILVQPGQPAVGDVVLAWVEGCRYVVHRIIRIDGDRVTLMGDGNVCGVEHCTLPVVASTIYIAGGASVLPGCGSGCDPSEDIYCLFIEYYAIKERICAAQRVWRECNHR